ncbi:uncharacterized protein LOC133904799 [Phragmites australis]|uniref:uncharacterized protein LOC133904799 n=1 Tax=Phragmites australis TaxID=29695 RepID=UPI002D79645A|nr:uncharacterized protein LOC133904799 [Phragmites australis]
MSRTNEEAKAKWKNTFVEAAKAQLEKEGDEEMDSQSDDEALQAEKFRNHWIELWSAVFGSFEETTHIPSMLLTDNPAPQHELDLCDSLQVFSAKITGIRGGLQFPLDVFGVIAIRDSIEPRRNIIFSRTRDNCQALTEEDPYLLLTGPTRAVLVMDPVTIEVMLKVKGAVESEDKILNFQAAELICFGTMDSLLFSRAYTSKLSTLEFTLGQIVWSVEATIFVQVVNGSWADGFLGQFAAFTIGRDRRTWRQHGGASFGDEKVVLLDSGDKNVPVSGDGQIELSRRVVSVDVYGKLKLSVKAWQDGNSVMDEVCFEPRKAGRSYGMLQVGICKIEVTVAWSLISFLDHYEQWWAK